MNSITRKFVSLLLLSGAGYSLNAMNCEKDFASERLENNKETGFVPVQRFKAASYGLTCATFSPDGKTILTGSKKKTACLWDFKTGALIRTFEGHTQGINTVAFNADGETILTGSEDGYAQLWNSKTGDLIRTIVKEEYPIRSIACNSKGEAVLSSDRGVLIFWNTKKEEFVRVKDDIKLNCAITSVAFSPDEKTIVIGVSTRGYAYLVDVTTKNVVRTFDRYPTAPEKNMWSTSWINCVAFSPDGKTVLAGVDDKIAYLWNAETGELVRTFENGHANSITSVAFSPKGNTILTGGHDGKLCIWDSNTGDLLHLTTITYSVCSVAFSPDGNFILAGLITGEVVVWKINQ